MLAFVKRTAFIGRNRNSFCNMFSRCVVFCAIFIVLIFFFIPSMEGDTGEGGRTDELGGSSFVVGLIDLFTAGAENDKTNMCVCVFFWRACQN